MTANFYPEGVFGNCTYHKDGVHRSFVIAKTEGGLQVEHVCVCWLPTINHAGRWFIDITDPHAEDLQEWAE